MAVNAGLGEEDLYGLLGLSWRERSTYTTRDITRAYRRCALIHHPDKSRYADATARFGAIFDAHEILSDEKQRAAYDARLKARQEREERWGKEDAGRRKMRQDLETREREIGVRGKEARRKGREERLRREIDRLRREMGEMERRDRMERLERIERMEREEGRDRKDDEVPGLKEFRFGVGVSFEEYEKTVLEKISRKIQELEEKEMYNSND